MRSISTKLAGAVTLVALGAGAAIALRPAPGPTRLAGREQRPVVRVETQVIRRTIHVIKHRKPPHPAVGAPPSRAAGAGAAAPAAPAAAIRTSTSGSGRPGSGTAVPAAPVRSVRTRTSGAPAPAARRPSSRASAPVRTRTSGASQGPSKSAAPIRTRTSGSGHEGGDSHDD